MEVITKARKGALLRGLFELLLEHPDGLPASTALDLLKQRVELTPYELEPVGSSGRSRYTKSMHFATVEVARAGWLAKIDRTKWVVTEEGKQALIRFTDPYQFYREAINRRLSAQYAAGQTATPPTAPDEPTEQAEERAEALITLEQADDQAWAEIETYLRAMPPYEFQNLVAALLKAMGYHVSWVAPPGKDGGVDLLVLSDPLGTRAPRLKVQVKRYREGHKHAVDELRSFMAVLGEDDVGLFVTTSGFTKDAWEEARKQERRKITLIDLERFFDLWVEHYPKLDDAARRKFPLQPIYFLAPGN